MNTQGHRTLPITYRHTKTGKLYQVLGTALHTETHEQLVIYQPRYDTDDEFFARPQSMFEEVVMINGKERKRFERIDHSQ